nr:trypsin-3-like [Onthophagus taurus]
MVKICLILRSISELSISLGSSYHYLPNKIIKIHKFKVHDSYNSSTYDNDLAILLLVSKINFGPNILPISLPFQNETLPSGALGTVSGWGQTLETMKRLPEKLRSIQIPTISNERCAILNAPNLVTNNMICAKDLSGGRRDTCQGDSGSGFVVNGKLFGVTSWGIGCGRLNKAGVYTRISLYRDWIKLYTNI